jgi:hypothetical protein
MNRDEILEIANEIRGTVVGCAAQDIAFASRIESLVRDECQNEFKTACKMQINCAAAIRKSEG